MIDKKRNPNDPDLYDIDKLDDGYNKMIYFLEKFNLPYVVIDTDDKSLDEVNKVVDTTILEIKQNNKRLIKKRI